MHMRNCGSLTSGAGSGYGGWLVSGPCRRVRTQRGLPTGHHACLTLYPRPQRGQRLAGAPIVRINLPK